MALKVEILAIAMLLMALAADAQSGVFDLTKYNPKADIAEALLAAWKEACASTTPSKVLIPAGEYLMGPAELLGPCKAPIELQVEGTVKAPPEPKGESWVTFQQIDGFTLSGKGTFNGQGHIAWGNNNCHQNPACKKFPINCTLRNTDNGVRIKSWPAMKGGLASDIHFEDIIIDNVSNPVIVDQEYCPWNQCSLKEPSKVKLSKISFKNIRGTSNTPVAVKIVCSSGIPCEEVDLADINLTYSGNQGPAKSECKNAKIKVTGTLNP
ncbi:hypothetical protein Tsubulata_015806, partial [Turnera subulata]